MEKNAKIGTFFWKEQMPNPAKIIQTNFVFNIFEGFTWKKICSLACLIAKTKEKPPNKFVFPCTD